MCSLKHLGYPAWFEWNPGINLTTRNCWWVFSNSFSHVIRLLCQLVAKINLMVMLRTYFFCNCLDSLAHNKPAPKQKNCSRCVFSNLSIDVFKFMEMAQWRFKTEAEKKHIEKTPILRSRGGTGNLLVTPVRLGVLGFLNHPFLTDKEPLETDKWRCWGTRHVARHGVTPDFF